jgi:hypothetical protein
MAKANKLAADMQDPDKLEELSNTPPHMLGK